MHQWWPQGDQVCAPRDAPCYISSMVILMYAAPAKIIATANFWGYRAWLGYDHD